MFSNLLCRRGPFQICSSSGLLFRFSSSTTNKLESLSVLAFGSGSQGVLGQGELITSDVFEPIHVPGLPSDIVGVGAGSFHSLAWTARGQLWSWGRNKEHQLGRPLAATEQNFAVAPRPVDLKGHYNIIKATGSGVATFAITKEGNLLVCGSSKRGQLGLGPGKEQIQQFVPIEFPSATGGGTVIDVAAGWGHAAALVKNPDDSTSLYTWGWPANGRLGHSFASSIDEEGEEALYTRCVWKPKEVELLRGIRIVSVSCGMDTTYCLTQDGRILSFGDNSLGQLGRPELNGDGGEYMEPKDASGWELRVPRESDHTKDVKFRRIAAGLGHCLAVSGGGNIWSWGWNTASQLGLGEPGELEEVVYKPRAIFGVAKNRSALIAAGRVHSVLVTDDIVHQRGSSPTAFGHTWPCLTMVHSWGSAANGRLGTGTYEDAPFPELLTELDGELMLDVACGMDHTLLLVGKNWKEGEAGWPITAVSRSEEK